ncbi:HNH endonuclease [Streptomyces sp. BH097]|uniref:HNH endonuclease n=1 Tax=unclassified Streptomyces TaxID=2593676 RepID=UPI003BB52A87
MGLGDVTRAGVLAAVGECKDLGRESFRKRYDFDPSVADELVVDGNRYDPEVIAGVAHLYSVGDLLPAQNFSDGVRTVASHLRELGFTVEHDDAARGGAEHLVPQLVLQPRGGARDRGPQNFAHSVRRGIPIADIKDALGEQADVLTRLYPDGIARLWGSTPTTQVNNEKAKALRNRRVGDDVYFYAEKHFIARARIIHLFNSLSAARAVWGTDEENATWEHVMALGDVEEFPTAIPATPVLRGLGVPVPLRSLTLRSADDRRRVARLLPAARRPVPALPGTRLRTTRSQRTPEQLLERIGSLNTHRHPGTGAPSRHQPLALLWAISRIAADKPRLAPWSSFRSEVGPLLAEFGLPGSKVTPEYPFWHLKGSDLWEVHGIEEDVTPMPQPTFFNKVQPVAGLTLATAELLQNPLTRLETVIKLCSTYFADDVDQRQLLHRVGLGGYATADGLADAEGNDNDRTAADEEGETGPVGRRESTSSKPMRNPAIVSRVKELHRHECQVCGISLRYRRGPYSEAAHIRGLGTPHNGPDVLQNLLCLCPNHHVLFDGLEIYVDDKGMVRQAHGDKELGVLRRHKAHRIDEAHLRYHRTLCQLNAVNPR